jgi:hypothetical protein
LRIWGSFPTDGQISTSTRRSTAAQGTAGGTPAQKVVKNSAHGTVVAQPYLPPITAMPATGKGVVSQFEISSSDTRIFAELVRIPKIRTPR